MTIEIFSSSPSLSPEATPDHVAEPLVSVVIVTWNRKDDILATLQSLYDQAYQNFEIIVVDNASTDGTVDAIQQTYPEVRVVALDENLGPTGGRNAGFAAACGDFFFILDSDASPDDDTISQAVQKLQADATLGAVGCKVVNAYTKELDPDAPGWSYSDKDLKDQDKTFLSYSFAEGGCVFRREAIEQTGGFWDFLFFGREGLELSLRLLDADYRILYHPKSRVYHRVSPRKRIAGGLRSYFDFRNCLYIYLTRYPWWLLVCFLPPRVGLTIARGILGGYLGHIIRAMWEVLLHLPTVWKERQPIRSKTAWRYLRLQREHGPLHI